MTPTNRSQTSFTKPSAYPWLRELLGEYPEHNTYYESERLEDLITDHIDKQVIEARANELRIIKSENYTSGFEFDVYRRKRIRALKDTLEGKER